MKTSKRVLSFIMCLLLTVSLLALPASAEETEYNEYPFIFVHGLMGWGESSSLDSVLPYWGMTTGSLMDYLNSEGYESYAAQVGPLSSAWDRACELYAQLTGTRVDYGAAHSAEKGHDRYGVTYSEPLFEGWSAEKKINLVGHSFGGATIRLFLEILADGSAEEVAAAEAAGTEVSPFFEGGKEDWVYSLTAVAAPHNGTTFIESADTSTEVVIDLVYNLGATLGLSSLKGVYNLQLEHFGISKQEDETDLEYITRVLGSEEFMSHNDNAIYDLTIDNALVINDGIDLQENVYYFSVCGDATNTTALGTEVPMSSVFPVLKPYAAIMGCYYDKYTAGGFYIDKTWLPNDGMVNVVSGLYPFDSSGQCLKNDGSQGYVMCSGSGETYEKGIWNVMPTQPYDHLNIIGGIFSNTASATHSLYIEMLERVTGTYGSSDDNDETVLPFTDVEDGMWYTDSIRTVYEKGIMLGVSDTLFGVDMPMTREQFVTILYRMDGSEPVEGQTAPFADIDGCTWSRDAIIWAYNEGITNGCDNNCFCPTQEISREQMVTMLYRYAKSPAVSGELNLPDAADVSGYAYDAVLWAVQNGIVNGNENGEFLPAETATRAQTAVVIANYLGET